VVYGLTVQWNREARLWCISKCEQAQGKGSENRIAEYFAKSW